MKTKIQTDDARADYTSAQGHARWWAKDGAWHIALQNTEPGAAAGDLRWQDEAFDTREAAIAALEGRPRHYDITNSPAGWDVRESIGTAPWAVVATCSDFGTAQKLKTQLQAAQRVPALVAALTEARWFVRNGASPDDAKDTSTVLGRVDAALAAAKAGTTHTPPADSYQDSKRAQWFRDNAAGLSDDDPEVDDKAVVSEGEDDGAYVACWKWVPATKETPAKV